MITMTSDFGFKFLSPDEKTKAVQDIFKKVSSRYDLMNDLMSLTLHRCWKKRFIEAIPSQAFRQDSSPSLILDMAGGTGDILRLLIQRASFLSVSCQFILSDLNFSMLTQGQESLAQENLFFLCANAENLPLPQGIIALYTIAFGLRNVTFKEKALAEAFRVLKPGGFFYCLEFSHPTSPLLQGIYDIYSFKWIPLLGKYIAQEEKAYQYLVESIRTFPDAPLLQTLIQEAGFNNTGFQKLSGGLVAIHWGEKPQK